MDFTSLNTSKNSIDIITSALRIESVLSEHPRSYYLRTEKSQRLNPGRKPTFYLLTSGKVGIYRQCDDVLVMDVSAPMVIDICGLMMNISHHYYRCRQSSTLLALPQKDACLLFDEHALWKEILFLQCDQIEQHYQREEMSSGRSHYNIVREHLLHIWSLPPGDRDLTSVYLFILSRNKISRSSIYNIICALTNEGLIRTDRGKLVYLNKNKFNEHQLTGPSIYRTE